MQNQQSSLAIERPRGGLVTLISSLKRVPLLWKKNTDQFY